MRKAIHKYTYIYYPWITKLHNSSKGVEHKHNCRSRTGYSITVESPLAKGEHVWDKLLSAASLPSS